MFPSGLLAHPQSTQLAPVERHQPLCKVHLSKTIPFTGNLQEMDAANPPLTLLSREEVPEWVLNPPSPPPSSPRKVSGCQVCRVSDCITRSTVSIWRMCVARDPGACVPDQLQHSQKG